ncbi:MAG: hypothetical protein SGPRY_004821, partial [Prymnesium sp.]
GTAASRAFLSSAHNAGLKVREATPFLVASLDFSLQHKEVLASGLRVIVLLAPNGDSSRFLRTAFAEGIGGQGYLWIGGNGVSGSDLWESDPILAADSSLREMVLKGLFALQPGIGGVYGDAYLSYLARKRQIPSTMPTQDGSCNQETDDDGNPLWAADHDNDPTTPLACAGESFQKDGTYDSFAYDAIMAVAHALHELIELQNKSVVEGPDLVAALESKVRFQGVTGLIDFDEGTGQQRLYHGDRRLGISYNLLNFVDSNRGLVHIGMWTPCKTRSCSWSERWQLSADMELTFSTKDNSKPSQRALPLLQFARLGILLPMFQTQAAGSTRVWWSPTVGVYQAMREINNKTDGVADDLLPFTTIQIAYADSKCDSVAALQGALKFRETAFASNGGVDAIIGAGCSSASVSAAQIAQGLQVPIISPASSSPALGDFDNFPFFLRTFPSDALIARGMAEVLRHLLGYSGVSLISSTGSYGSGGATAFADASKKCGLAILASVSFLEDADEFGAQHFTLKSSRASVLVVFAQGNQASLFRHKALQAGYGGAGYLWMFSSGAITTIGADDDLTGSFALSPGNGVGSAAHRAYLERRHNLPPIVYPNGSCSREMDSERKAYLWGELRHDGEVEEFVCAKEAPLRESIADAFAYDAVFAVAHALHELIVMRNCSQIDGVELREALLTGVRFEGVTGWVSFDDSLQTYGDRREGLAFHLRNWVGQRLVTVGKWQPCDGCSWNEMWISVDETLTFSTADNSKPLQRASCPSDQMLTPEGTCACGDGYELDPTQGECTRCGEGQDSRGGSQECSLCAAGYYRAHPHLPATECASCSSFNGLSCPLNATVERLEALPGWWRLSPHSTKAYKCDEEGGIALSCAGGGVGDLSCAANHSGPLCSLCVLPDQFFDSQQGVCLDCPDSRSPTAAIVSIFVLGPLLAAMLYSILLRPVEQGMSSVHRLLLHWVHALKQHATRIGLTMKLKVLLTFAQIVATLDSTYNIGLPSVWFEWTSFLRSIGEIDWLSWLLPADCFLGRSALNRLCALALTPLVVVLTLPLAGALIRLLRRQSISHGRGCEGQHIRHKKWSSLRSDAMAGALDWLPPSLLVAFCFAPAVSSVVFHSWHCHGFDLDGDVELFFLRSDLSVQCEESDHRHITAISWVFVALWPVGSVLLYVAMLLPCRALVYDEIYWWEVLSLIHRTTLTGWLLLFDASQHFMQLLTALIVSLAYLMLLLVCRPFKRRLDHFLAAGCQLLVFFLFLFGLSVHLHHEIAHDVDGSLSLASRLLGLDSSDDIAVIMILIAIFMVILFGLTLLAESVAQHLEQRRAMTWSICTMDPPRIVWKRKRTRHILRNHTRATPYLFTEAGSEARYIHDILRKMIRAPVFLDSSALNDLRELITEGVHQSDTLLLLATGGVLRRPWCLLEVLEAHRKQIPIVAVELTETGFSYAEARRYVLDIESELGGSDPSALEVLRRFVGDDLTELKDALLAMLSANESQPLIFRPHAGDNAMVAMMEDVVDRMSQSLGMETKWISDAANKSFMTDHIRQLTHAFRSQRLSIRSMGSRTHAVKSVAVKHKLPGLINKLCWGGWPTHERGIVTAFVCCARADALSHARVLRSKLAIQLGRNVGMSGGADSTHMIDTSTFFVVLLTKGLIFDPVALYEIWYALELEKMLITVSITGAGYDHERTSSVFADLPTALANHGVNPLVLSSRLPKDVELPVVATQILTCLRAVIALAWSPASDHQLQAVVLDIIRRAANNVRIATPQRKQKRERGRELEDLVDGRESFGSCF